VAVRRDFELVAGDDFIIRCRLKNNGVPWALLTDGYHASLGAKRNVTDEVLVLSEDAVLTDGGGAFGEDDYWNIVVTVHGDDLHGMRGRYPFDGVPTTSRTLINGTLIVTPRISA
jgi:hypothetical protein